MVTASAESIISFYVVTPYIFGVRIHKIYRIATHTQIQFELYYFHYNICLHTDAIYVLL